MLRRRSWSMRWDCWWGGRGRRNVFRGGGGEGGGACGGGGGGGGGEEDLSVFVDRTPIMLGEDTPMEVVAEVFGKVGCRYVCIVEDGRGVGVVIKKRF